MQARDMNDFSQSRVKARAYFCYLFSKNIPNGLPSVSLESVQNKLLKIRGDLKECEGIYVLDAKGVQLTPTYTPKGKLEEDKGSTRSDRAYYYRAMKEKRCTITDPYPSLLTNDLTVTASQPVFDENEKLLYVACVDMPLKEVLKIANPTAMSSIFGKVTRISYAIFALALGLISLMLFFKGMGTFAGFMTHFNDITVNEIFQATILLTLSLAIFDLVKTLFTEEVLGHGDNQDAYDLHKTMVRFIGSIVIALAIESLMLVFKFAMTEPDKLLYAMYIIGGVFLLIVGLAIYIKLVNQKGKA
ncbi:MAG: PDC sensor domain-containing protein [Campylobacterota bacterium]|nr:PDC sensor domain-containing protein [Campylobacterota bacterium]